MVSEKLEGERLENFLKMFPIGRLRLIAKNVDAGITGRSKDDIAKKLAKKGLDNEEIENLKKIKTLLDEETKKIHTLVFGLPEKVNEEGLVEAFTKVPLERDDRGMITQDGFSNSTLEQTESDLKIRYFYLYLREEIDENYDKKEYKEERHVDIEVLIPKRLFLVNVKGVSHPITSLRNDANLTLLKTTIFDNSPNDVKEEFEKFVSELSSKLTGLPNQPKIVIMAMAFLYSSGRFKKKIFDGRQDIFSSPEIASELGKEGKIVYIDGILTHKTHDFDFKVGFFRLYLNYYVGVIELSQKGNYQGDPSIKEEVYQILLGLFKNIFGKYYV